MHWHEEVLIICAKEILIPFEGYATKLPDGSCMAYPDPYSKIGKKLVRISEVSGQDLVEAGKPWTIGYGSTFDIDGSPVLPGMIWTHDKAISVKTFVMKKFLKELLSFSPSLVREPPKRVAAILSWFYNLGAGSYRISTFKKRIDEKLWEEAAIECIKWDKAGGVKSKGLARRRNLEALYIRNAE